MTAGPWNPKGKVNERVGLCQCDEHHDMSENPKRGNSVRLWMLYSDEYLNYSECDRHSMSDEERDIAWEEMEKIQWVNGSEKYYCEDCCEGQMC